MKKEGVLILICLSVLTITTPFLCRQSRKTYQPDDISQICISSCGGYLSPYYNYVWDFEKLTYTFSVTNSGSSNVEESQQTESFSADDAESMIAACNQYGAFDWDEMYGEEGTCEAGDSFCVIFRDGTSRWTEIGAFGDTQPPHYDEVHAALFQFKHDSEPENLQGV